MNTHPTQQEDLRLRILFDIGKKTGIEKGKEWVRKMTFEDFLTGLKDMNERDKDFLEVAILALDEYWRVRSMKLLEWMAENDIQCAVEAGKEQQFYYKGEWITKEELFQNFL